MLRPYNLRKRELSDGCFWAKYSLKINRNSISRQLVKAGTSVGANYEEAQGAFSKQEFRYKVTICLKEVRETQYWLRLINSKLKLENELIKKALEEA